jgi:ABC-2 type transport system permease protein
MIITSPARPRPSATQQWWVLTIRSIVPTLRNGELATAIAASVIFTAGFYIPLKELMGVATHGIASSYAQFLTPLIALQAVSFASISGAFRAATDAAQGINRRFGSMPIATLTPAGARMSANVYRCVIGLAIALISGHVIGFRFHRGPADIVGFCLLVVLIGIVLSLLADLIGTKSRSPESTTPLLMLPQLIFGLLSVGVQPAEQFPEWIQPVVRNQPISQFVYALRALAGDTGVAGAASPTWSVMGPALFWLFGALVILVPMSAVITARRP